MSSNDLKAYHVGEDSEGGHVVVFATSGAAARRAGGNELDLEFSAVEFCRRAQWADQYAGQPFIPAKAFHDAGWWLRCSYCETTNYDDAEDDDGNPLTMVYDGPDVYCSQSCKDAKEKDIDDANERGDAFIRKVHEARPDLHFVRFRCGWPYVTMTAEFTFPGCRYGGEIVDQKGDGNLAMYVAGYDGDDFQAYERSRNRAVTEQRA
ncbi:hypothetical protein [Pseudomonas sp. ML96]|uniref:hypothetical protein n=1 Tax=Pseudomonas sp. ML96 TaxID=1523503 RepID=UPI0005BD6374|nr:hypothetical protein [Pseudomonas sp. ML96]